MEEIGTTKLKNKTPCPSCGKNLDGVSGNKKGPTPMDATVCAYCLEWCIFLDDLQLRSMTEEEIVSLSDETFKKLTEYTQLVAKHMIEKRREGSL